MIRVFSFVGSCAGEDSATAKLSDDLAEAFRKAAETEGEKVSYERMTGADLRVDYCRSCGSCFKNGICPLDRADDMPKLKEKMKECDVLLFGSPVYLWEMSGITKSVIDRISYWSHRLELLGKPCAVFTTMDMSHGAEVADNLRLLMTFMGAVSFDAGHQTQKDRGSPEIFQKTLCKSAERLLKLYHDPCSGITPFQQRTFFSLVYANRRRLLRAAQTGRDVWEDVRICEERGINRYVLMAEAVEALCNGKITRDGVSEMAFPRQ